MNTTPNVFRTRCQRRCLVGIAAPAIALSLLAGALAAGPASEALPAPPLALPDLNGHTVKLDDYPDCPVGVLFFASWDQYSREQTAILMQLQKEWTNEHWAVVAISIDPFLTSDPLRRGASPGGLAKWADQEHAKFPILLANQKTIGDWGGLEGIPTLILTDRQHNIVHRHVGLVDRAVLESELKKLLGK